MTNLLSRKGIQFESNMQPIRSAEDSSIADYSWLHCNFCLHKFSPNRRFCVFSCQHICCENCAKNFSVRGSHSVLHCPRCNKNISYRLISDQLERHIRVNFEPLNVQFKNLASTDRFQRQHREQNNKFANEQNEKLREEIHQLRAKTIQSKKILQAVDQQNQALETKLLSVMSKERIAQLLDMSEEDLEHMDGAKMLNRPRTPPTANRHSARYAAPPNCPEVRDQVGFGNVGNTIRPSNDSRPRPRIPSPNARQIIPRIALDSPTLMLQQMQRQNVLAAMSSASSGRQSTTSGLTGNNEWYPVLDRTPNLQDQQQQQLQQQQQQQQQPLYHSHSRQNRPTGHNLTGFSNRLNSTTSTNSSVRKMTFNRSPPFK